jgi:hypothetical protein
MLEPVLQDLPRTSATLVVPGSCLLGSVSQFQVDLGPIGIMFPRLLEVSQCSLEVAERRLPPVAPTLQVDLVAVGGRLNHLGDDLLGIIPAAELLKQARVPLVSVELLRRLTSLNSLFVEPERTRLVIQLLATLAHQEEQVSIILIPLPLEQD